ncbi:MAG: hypothetical protein KIT22_09865 [Verrucomicrobiae bacterium]|nr:hypothetical protein [Verrucomicrobiae bacterium]
MPSLPIPGELASKRLTTGRLYFQPSGSSSEIDLGNVTKWKRTDRSDTVEHMASAGGFRIVDATYVHTIGFGYIFTVDEYVATVLELRAKALTGSQQTVAAAATGTTVTLANVVLGRAYPVGSALGVTIESVAVGAVTKTAWSFNTSTGRLTILEGGDITANDSVVVTYRATGGSYTRHFSGRSPLRTGNFTFFEHDQISPLPRAIHVWSGIMWVNDDFEQTMEAFGTVDLHCPCNSRPVVDERQS